MFLLGTFTLLGCLISLWDITSHLRNYNKPDIQRRVCAILWMVPIYSVTSWFSLVFPASAAGLGTLRDCYEAYAVYTFIGFLIAIISNEGGWRDAIIALADEDVSGVDRDEKDARTCNRISRSESGESEALMLNETVPLMVQTTSHNRPSYSSLVDLDDDNTPSVPGKLSAAEIKAERDLARDKRLRPPFPCCLNKNATPRQKASNVIYQCVVMAMQFVLIKPILAFLPVVFYLLDKPYNTVPMFDTHNRINWHSPQVYTYMIENLSVMIAFYGLLSFYYATARNISMYNPWPKFLCIKGVVFVTFWQSVGIGAMYTLGFATESEASQMQNFLICVEMLLASIAHYYIFPYEEWEDDYVTKFNLNKTKRNGLGFHDSLAFRDFATDMKRLVTKHAWDAETPTGSERNGGIDDAPASPISSRRASRGAALIASAPCAEQTREESSTVDQSVMNSPGDIFGSVVHRQNNSLKASASSSHSLMHADDDDSVSEAQV